MGERLYFKGVGDTGPDQCLGKLIMYSDFDALTCIPFLKGYLSGYNEAVSYEYNTDAEKISIDEWECIDGWQWNGYAEITNTIPRYIMRKFISYYIEDKERQNVFPLYNEYIKELFDYTNQYEYFEISFGG